MKIGYPCINLTLECRPSRTFRLASYSERILAKTVENNLDCMQQILNFNLEHNILFLRITSDLVPFASHPICKFNWQEHFDDGLRTFGDAVKKGKVRISMHPDQFTLINSPDERIFENSQRELIYHTQLLDLMGLDEAAKIQIHVGGVYGNKCESTNRFVKRFHELGDEIRRRLVVENDEKSYDINDCFSIYLETGLPLLFDAFHHEVNNSGESVEEGVQLSSQTWRRQDGIPMVDYSSQQRGERKGTHVETIDIEHFKKFLEKTRKQNFDIMLEIKDKEKSALKAIKIALTDPRFIKATEGSNIGGHNRN